MNLNLTCVKNSINGQDIYTCVKEPPSNQNVEHFGPSYNKNQEAINASMTNAINTANDLVLDTPNLITTYKTNNPHITDSNMSLLYGIVHSPAINGKIIPGLLCNNAIPFNDTISRSGRKLNGVNYEMQENDLYVTTSVNQRRIYNSIKSSPSITNVCISGARKAIGGETQQDDKIWAPINWDLGTNKCNSSNKSFKYKEGYNAYDVELATDRYTCVHIPGKPDAGYWMDSSIPTTGTLTNGLPTLNYNPANYTTTYTANFDTQAAPAWARYCDITCIGPGGNGGKGGNGNRKNNVNRTNLRGGSGAGGGNGGYIKIHRLRLTGGYANYTDNMMYQGFSGIIDDSITKVGPRTNRTADLAYTVAIANKGGNGGDGGNASKTDGGSASTSVGGYGSITYNTNLIGGDQVFTSGGYGSYGSAGGGGEGGSGNDSGSSGGAGTRGCIIITYYYNSTD